jgi:hypothetical protein
MGNCRTLAAHRKRQIHGMRSQFQSSKLVTALLLGLTVVAGWAQSDFQGAMHPVPFNEAPIEYEKQKSSGPISRLEARIASGETKLKYDPVLGWLPALLEELGVSHKSQMLVFSKTSLQRSYISPRNPRALYFNDEMYIGWIPGAPVMEISEVDPLLGTVFYDLDNLDRDRPRFKQNSQCLNCHSSARSMGVPGHVLRSIGTDEAGEPDQMTAASEVNHRTPLADRWAGWYVTGSAGEQTHRGNCAGPDAVAAKERNRTSLDDLVNLEGYLRKDSDMVAMLVHDHQTHMHNFITRLNFETRIMMHRYGHIRYLRHQVDAFLRYLTFAEETELAGPVVGTSGFAEEFADRGPKDSTGRSLRDLDLKSRLFQYPCSYVIYTPSFDAIPEVMREHVLERLHAILSGEDDTEAYQRISPRAKEAALEILRETKKNLPDYWRVTSN